MGRKIKEIRHVDDDNGRGEISWDEGYEGDDGIDLEVCFDFLKEDIGSSSIRREDAFRQIIKSLERYELVDNTFFIPLLHHCHTSIEEEGFSLSEKALAARIVGLVALTAGPTEDEEVSDILQGFLYVIFKSHEYSKDCTTTSSLLDCLAILNFVCDDDVEQNKELMEFTWELVTKSSGNAKVSALLAFGFLLTTMTIECFPLEERMVSYVLSLLDCEQSAIRITAGEILALILEIKGLDNLDEGVRSEFLQKSKSLVAEATGKKNLKSQRKTFNQIVQFLEQEATLTKNGDILERNSWGDLMKLNFLKQFLGEEGFTEHVQKNEFIRLVLKVSEELGGSEESSDQKKLIRKTDSRLERRIEHVRLGRWFNPKKILIREKTKNLNKDRDLKVHLRQH